MSGEVVDNVFYRELLALNAMNPFFYTNSSPRGAMFMSHVGQALTLLYPDRRRTVSGLEFDLAKYTFSIKTESNIEVIRRIDRYPPTVSYGNIKENPETVILYEDVETKEVGLMRLVRYKSMDRQFGFRYKYKPIERELVPERMVRAGTVIADSPAVTEDGMYCYGVEGNVAFMSVPAVIEDGVVVRSGFLEKMKTLGYEDRVAAWGENRYPLNLYGDENNYKPFPDIGDRIRDDGLLFAMREYDDILAVADMTPTRLMKPDFYYDTLVYAEPRAKVVDVNVYHDPNKRRKPTPVGMEVQTKKYHTAASKFHDTILGEYFRLRGRRREDLQISKEFHQAVVDSLAHKASVRVNGSDASVVLTHRLTPIDDWRVEVVYEYEIVPTIGFKLSDSHGGKAVICDVWDDADMPVDDHGNRADFIMDGDSIIKRMNVGRLYEQYINAAARDTSREVARLLGKGSPNELKASWEYLLGFYRIISPQMCEMLTSGKYPQSPEEHLKEISRHGIYEYLPPENPVRFSDMVRQLRLHYPAHLGPVTYRGRSGNQVRTVDNVLIGSMYIILLEKTGGDWSGVSSAKLQHFGIPAKLTNADKHGNPGRAQPVRLAGETEGRIFAAMVGSDVIESIINQSNDPIVHKGACYTILTAEEPANIVEVVNREELPSGNGRPIAFLRHILECGGIRIVTPDARV